MKGKAEEMDICQKAELGEAAKSHLEKKHQPRRGFAESWINPGQNEGLTQKWETFGSCSCVCDNPWQVMTCISISFKSKECGMEPKLRV